MIRYVLFFFCLMVALFAQSKPEQAYKQKDYDAAIEAWNKVLETQPELNQAYYNRGNAEFYKGDLESAIKSYEQSLSEDDQARLADVYYNLGTAHLFNQDVEKAKTFYKQALRLRPDDEDAKANLELLSHMPPPPPQPQQGSGENGENQDQQGDQPSPDSQHQQGGEDQQDNQDQSQQENQEQQQEQPQPQSGDEDKEQSQPQPAEEAKSDETSQDERLNAQQVLDALKDRETENMKAQIRLKTSGQDHDKDW